MNTTLRSLSVASLGASPLFAAPMSDDRRRYLARDSHFNRFASPFFRTQSSRVDSSFMRSYFTDFLNTAIVISDKDAPAYTKVSNHMQVYGRRSNTNIFRCVFENCKSELSHGGAVLYDLACLNGSCIESAFVSCTTVRNGGGLYCYLAEFILARTCFTKCFALDFSHDFTIYHSTYDSVSNVTDVTISETGSLDTFYGRASSLQGASRFFNRFTNNTDNRASLLVASSCFVSTETAEIAFCTYHNNSGPSVFAITRGQDLHTLSYCIFTNNVGTDKLFSLGNKTSMVACQFAYNVQKIFATPTDHNIHVELKTKNCMFDFEARNVDRIEYDEVDPVETDYFDSGLQVGNGVCGPYQEYSSITDLNAIFLKIIRRLLPKDNEKNIEAFDSLLKIDRTYPIPDTFLQTDDVEEKAQNIPSPTHIPTASPQPTPTAKFVIEDDVETEVITPEPTQSLLPLPTRVPKKKRTPKPVIQISKKPKSRNQETPTRKKKLYTPTPTQPVTEVFSPTVSFSLTAEFTTSVSSSASIVPLVLYSASAFVVLAVMASFCMLKTSDTGYSIIGGSESAERRTSDAVTGSSSAVTA